jgi:hypothetical protein
MILNFWKINKSDPKRGGKLLYLESMLYYDMVVYQLRN